MELGELLVQGQGPDGARSGVEWLGRAADAGSVAAMRALARIYADGSG